MSYLSLENITKTYGSTTALDSVSLKIEGGCTAILGPNGAGKTTMMKLITRIARPSSGNINVNGFNLRESPEKLLASIGSLVEQPEFYTYLTGREILTFICRIRGIEKSEIKDEIDRVSKLCGVTPFLDRKSGGYSRGMKQRLGLASVLVSEPDILILDEPTFGLDPKGIVEMRNIIRNYSRKEGKTVMLSTHLISEAAEISDRVVILDMGSVKYDSSMSAHSKKLIIKFEEKPASIEDDPAFSEITWKDELTAMLEVKKKFRNSDLIEKLIQKGIKIRSVTETLGLEEIYLNIMDSHPTLDRS